MDGKQEQHKRAILEVVKASINNPTFFKLSTEQQINQVKEELHEKGVFEKESKKTQKRE